VWRGERAPPPNSISIISNFMQVNAQKGTHGSVVD
jgi:hypothetical protein